MGSITRRTLAALLLSAAVVAAGAVPAQSAPAQSTQPPAPDIGVLTGIRTGVHPNFDRIVLDFSGPPPEISSRFVDELIQDGFGDIEWLTGAAFVEVIATPAYAHDDQGSPSWPGPRKFRTRNLTNVMAVAITGDSRLTCRSGSGCASRPGSRCSRWTRRPAW